MKIAIDISEENLRKSKRWGEGCKTSEDGYCFLFEPKEDEE